jgi:hypothetical protein
MQMSELKDSLYDIGDAIALSQRLAGVTNAAPKEPDSPYIRFYAGPQPAPTVRSMQDRVDTALRADQPPLPKEPFRNWEEVLKWCIDFSKATSGFIVDSQGFVMMMQGERLPDDGFEGAGANLGVVFNCLNKMEIESGDVRIADLTYEKRSMLAVRVTDAAGEYCTLGILSAGDSHLWPKHAIYQQIMKNMSNLLL